MRKLTAKIPPTSKMVKIIVKILKYLSMNSVIGSPNFHINNETNMNLADLLIVDARRNIGKFMLNAPEVIVIILNGIGVNPAVKTIKILLSSYCA